MDSKVLTVENLVNDFGFKLLAGEAGLKNEINGVYIGDLLSWVMGRAEEGNAWLTIQGHVNIVAVALLTSVSCIIVCEGSEVDAESILKSNKEEIPLLSTDLKMYDAAKIFIQAGIGC